MKREEIDAMLAGKELDRLIAEKVMRWRLDISYPYRPDNEAGWRIGGGPEWLNEKGEPTYHFFNDCPFCPSTDLDAAVEATEALAPIAPGASAACSWRFRLLRDHDRGYWADVWTIAEDASWQAGAPTPALALCRALLKATLP